MKRYTFDTVIAKALCILMLLVAVGTVLAQQNGKLYVGPTTDANIRWAQKADFDGSILFCRGNYTSTRHEENGSGWWTDYPGADNNFMTRLSELTEVRVRFDEKRIPFFVVLGLSDPLLFKCPVLFMSDVGTIAFSASEVNALRAYFTQGGFLWVDDFWGSQAWDQWEEQIRRVLPSGLFPMVDLPNSHPILHQLYDVRDGVPQMPTIGLWGTCGGGLPEDSHGREGCEGGTSERGADSADVHFRGILDDEGRVIVVATHNTDIADGWEEEGKPENVAYLNQFSARAYAIGVNIFLYALTH